MGETWGFAFRSELIQNFIYNIEKHEWSVSVGKVNRV